MTNYLVRTDLSTPLSEPEQVRVLDWAPADPAATIQTGEAGPEFFTGWRTTRAAADLLVFAASVYCADKTTLRRETLDAWTRTITVDTPVAEPAQWPAKLIESTLRFLTGDAWTISVRASQADPLVGIRGMPAQHHTVGLGVDAVCLFSGGLDSLCGAIDLLESSPMTRMCLFSHHEGGQASSAQQNLVEQLQAHYGNERIVSRRLYLRPAPANNRQARALPHARENTTRSRSILFLSSALALAAAEGPNVPVYVPENGFIGINVPLTRARAGSASTRTTHPHFMEQFRDVSTAIGVANPVINPYRLRTKGEMLAESRNQSLLRRLAPGSVSCSHPEAARYVRRAQGNCGYCFPCLIRRASLSHVDWDSDHYAFDVFDDQDVALLLDRPRARGADLRAVLSGAFVDRPDRDALRNGPLPHGERADFTDVWRRGLTELRAWLTSRPSSALAQRAESLS